MIDERIIKVIDAEGWYFHDEGNGEGYLERHTPAGEDYIINVDPSTADALFQSIYDEDFNFDVDEHVEMWVEAKHNGVCGVPRVVELVDDAREITAMLESLVKAVGRALDEIKAEEAEEK